MVAKDDDEEENQDENAALASKLYTAENVI